MKNILLLILVCLGNMWTLKAQEHPVIYASASDKATILQKIADEEWAKEAFTKIRGNVEKYADRHTADPQWIISRLAMYWKEGERYTQCYLKNQNWDRGEGDAPVPTVRMPGMRTWNKYYNVPLEDRQPYNETGDMLGLNRQNPSAPPVLVPYKESGHMVRGNNVEILTLAENAAFVYWVTGEEKFARFAADIFNTWLIGTYYMNPILDPEKSTGGTGGWEPGGICGYYDYEQIHDDLALHAATVYDFLYDYLNANPHVHLKEIGKETKEVAGVVFKRFIDIGFIRGGKSGNWNVNGWNMILRPILVLEENEAYPDGKGKDYYLHYLTNESTIYHDAIPDMVKTYDPVTGLWPESPGYSFGTIQMLLDWAILLKRSGIDVIADNPILQKAAMAVFPWMDDAANMVVFGDSRGGSANFLTFENLLTYYTQTANKKGIESTASALNKGLSLGKYNRSNAGWTGICTYAPTIPVVKSETSERTSYSPHHRFITMKNWTAPFKMMAALYGGTDGYHLTANGLALQLYGYGYALAPDAAAYESYWSKDHVYHQSPVGANTILPGYSEGKIVIEAMEPMVESGKFVNEKALTPFLNFADISAGEKRRTVALVRTSDSDGYYIDIFRSDLNDNDYLFHNVGTNLEVVDVRGNILPFNQQDKFERTYHAGYEWFTNIRKTEYARNFIASWTMPENITARLWMTGEKGRQIYKVDAPATTLNKGLTPGNVSMPPSVTPTLIVRQEDNNAKAHPFVSVYEAYKGDTPHVKQVTAMSVGENCAGVKVLTGNKREDYVFSATDSQVYSLASRTFFSGTFGLISEVGGKIYSMYLGKGRLLQKGNYSLEAEQNVYATIYQVDGNWFYSATGPVKVKIGKMERILDEGYNKLLNIK